MTPADTYRIRAAQLMASSRFGRTPAQRLEVERLAASYRRLAEQADRNSEIDVVYETQLVPRPQPQVKRLRHLDEWGEERAACIYTVHRFTMPPEIRPRPETRRMALVLPAIFGVLFLIIFALIGLAS
jgi:hypothetical protein